MEIGINITETTAIEAGVFIETGGIGIGAHFIFDWSGCNTPRLRFAFEILFLQCYIMLFDTRHETETLK